MMKTKCHFIQDLSSGDSYLRCEIVLARQRYAYQPVNETLIGFNMLYVEDGDFDPNGRLAKMEYSKLWKKKYTAQTPDIPIQNEDELLKPYVEWLTDSIKDRWSFRLMYKRQSFISGDRMWLEFYFENKMDLGHFALRWK